MGTREITQQALMTQNKTTDATGRAKLLLNETIEVRQIDPCNHIYQVDWNWC